MSIDYSRLRSITARRLATALSDDGFELQRQKGSHRHYRHPDGRRVTLSFHHSSDTFPHGTLRRSSKSRRAGTKPTFAGLL